MIAALLAAAGCAPVEHRHDGDTRSPDGTAHCVRPVEVDHVEIVNAEHILFFMRDRSIYDNRLERRCPGLRLSDTIMYRTTLNRLCDIDTFTVLESTAVGFMPGPSCRLGMFYPVSRTEADALKQATRRK